MKHFREWRAKLKQGQTINYEYMFDAIESDLEDVADSLKKELHKRLDEEVRKNLDAEFMAELQAGRELLRKINTVEAQALVADIDATLASKQFEQTP